MKKILVLFCLAFISFSAKSQHMPIDSATGKYSFHNIVMVDSVSKDELYVRANEWFAQTFVSANNVLQMQDKSAGKLIGKGYGDIRISVIGTVTMIPTYFTISVSVKDGKYKYEITDIVYKPSTVPSRTAEHDFKGKKKLNGIQKQYVEETTELLTGLEKSLNAAMQQTAKKSDW